MANATDPIQGESLLERGFKNSNSAARSYFRNAVWVTSNLPAAKKRELFVIGSHLVRCLDMLDLESSEGLPLDVWKEVRDELSDAFCGKPASAEYAALEWVVEHNSVPKQYIFDMVNAADYWIRFQRFDTWEQLDTFASNLGGSAMVAACRVAGGVKPGYELPALSCGKAILLTHKLAHCYTDLKSNRNFLAAEDLDKFELEIHRLKMRHDCLQLKQFVRFTVARLEKLFAEGMQLLNFMEFGAARSVTSLLSVYWRVLTRLRMNPASIYDPHSIITRRDLLGLKSRHLLGLEGGIPFMPNQSHH